MPRHLTVAADLRSAHDTVREVQARLTAGWDPDRAIAHLNAQVVAFQRAGADLPAELLRFTRSLTGSRPAYSRRHPAA
jgi:hypothetical protein